MRTPLNTLFCTIVFHELYKTRRNRKHRSFFSLRILYLPFTYHSNGHLFLTKIYSEMCWYIRVYRCKAILEMMVDFFLFVAKETDWLHFGKLILLFVYFFFLQKTRERERDWKRKPEHKKYVILIDINIFNGHAWIPKEKFTREQKVFIKIYKKKREKNWHKVSNVCDCPMKSKVKQEKTKHWININTILW